MPWTRGSRRWAPLRPRPAAFPDSTRRARRPWAPRGTCSPCDPSTGWGQALLDESRRERTTTRRLLEQFSIGSSEANAKALDLTRELRELTQKQHLELRRSFGEVLRLSLRRGEEGGSLSPPGGLGRGPGPPAGDPSIPSRPLVRKLGERLGASPATKSYAPTHRSCSWSKWRNSCAPWGQEACFVPLVRGHSEPAVAHLWCS